MIHLDTNYLIGLLVKGSPQVEDVDGWLAAGEPLAASAVAWTEFLNGPVTPLEVSRAEAVLQSRIIPFGRQEAVLAADLFNKTGRRRGSDKGAIDPSFVITHRVPPADAAQACATFAKKEDRCTKVVLKP